MPSGDARRWQRKALVLGRSGVVRSLGRAGISVTLVREGKMVFERASRYCREFICLPNLVYEREKAVEVLEEYGSRQTEKPVAFFNGESDVMLFSEYRERLEKYYTIMLSPHELIVSLIDKGQFKQLADKHNLAVPKTAIPMSREECISAADDIGYPCVLKPVKQRRWHQAEILEAIGLRKGILLKSKSELESLLDKLPPIEGGEMVQEFVPGGDDRIYEFHAYIDRGGRPTGAVLGQKIRTYPIHFGQSAYAYYVNEPKVIKLCLDTLAEAIGEEVDPVDPSGKPRRWLWFGTDRKAMVDYWRRGEITPWKWLRSFFTYKGTIDYHVFAWDDPIPLMAYLWFAVIRFMRRGWGFIKRRLGFAGA